MRKSELQSLDSQRLAYKDNLANLFWNRFFSAKIAADREDFSRLLDLYNIPLKVEDSVVPVLISIQSNEETARFQVAETAREVILDNINGVILPDYNGFVMVLIYNMEELNGQAEKNRGFLSAKCDNFSKLCDNWVKTQVSYLVGKPTPLSDISQYCWNLSQNRLLNGIYRNCGLGENETFKTDISCLSDWVVLADSENKDRLFEKVNQLFDGLSVQWRTNTEILQEIYTGICYLVFFCLHKRNITADSIVNSIPFIKVTDSLENLKEWTFNSLEMMFQRMGNTGRNQSTIIENVEKYIVDHISENCTREDISKSVYLNPAYLSRLFKNKTGISLKQYVTQVRMKKATSMLRGKCKNISAVAEEVGYTNFSYFSRTFKKCYGVTPNEYQKLYI